MHWYKISYKLYFVFTSLLMLFGAYFTAVSIKTYATKDPIYRLKGNEELPLERLEELVADLRTSAALANSGIMYQDLALAELILADKYGYFTPGGNKILQDSYQHIHKGVELSPARSIGWTRMAYIKFLLEGASKDIVDIVNMAIIVAPDEYDSMYFRIKMSFALWEYFNDEQKQLIRQQIRLGWNKHKEKVIDLVNNKISGDIVDSAMRESGDYEEFKKRAPKY